MWSASDEALVAGMAAGEAEAALVFVRRFQSRVFGLAQAMTRDAVLADDVAQEAFVRAWRYGTTYDPRRGSVTGWLLGITRNVALDRVTRRARQTDRERTGDAVLDVLADITVDGDGVAASHADRSALVTALRCLPPEQREAIVGAAYLGWSAREMSERWSVPVGTVKTRLRLGLQKLRTSMAGAGR